MGKVRKVLVLKGGWSREREVSLISGAAIESGLAEAGYEVSSLDVRSKSLGILRDHDFEAAFIALHGGYGENGTLQQQLELRGVTYTGSGPEASSRAMDKPRAKFFFERNEIPTPRWEVLPAEAVEDGDAIDSIIAEFGLPCVVKPDSEGSSIGVSIPADKETFVAALDIVREAGDRVLIEEYIRGRELTVGILEEKALPVVEIEYPATYFDIHSKYESEETKYTVAPRLPEEVTEQVQRLAVAAHEALGCRHFSRVDVLLSEDNQPYVLEVNTIPGFTSHSLLPKAAAGVGISFGELCGRIVVAAEVEREMRIAV